MRITTTNIEINKLVRSWQKQGLSVGLIPTMGCLHQGHMSLVHHSQATMDKTLVYIFTNPMQFNDWNDYLNYPKTPEADLALLESTHVDAVFMPSEQEVYPHGFDNITQVHPNIASDTHHLESDCRLGHFTGVLTILTKMFSIIQADQAFLGEKDYDQLTLVRNMAEDLNLYTQVIGVATVREKSGLAMSSRNTLLNQQQKAIAPTIYQTLTQAACALKEGANIQQVEQQSEQTLNQAGFNSEYFRVLTPKLKIPTAADKQLTLLTAAYLGNIRLIDNLSCSR
ncbi:pantoate--beta-alanine ligase [Piscirickettsia salmonis]|uniref:Pantothenate synthetase n=1 Tax=Piscirickettsia salmonis TaxID=1238 RepID=A0A9Q6LT71_PISSA|nr:pantoate--beta-alanine ligase [Piscirickettsia salmonis]ALA23638.1 pantoate--beta-alanine ligase [Piscirickettsia salmonis]APS44079.1 pantoate--beta-alanine ligase [Piscirickettsia salmonis]APS47440.1 pantoate--beta-alanine ligase [Piscirickettsia salmonis]APS51124.1 pantoate--beta-alanine ligase [Piscirickettsia salmonis]APS54333.1 pantoate--beta-alanine ligase [Piscirickettsia salmonis]